MRPEGGPRGLRSLKHGRLAQGACGAPWCRGGVSPCSGSSETKEAQPCLTRGRPRPSQGRNSATAARAARVNQRDEGTTHGQSEGAAGAWVCASPRSRAHGAEPSARHPSAGMRVVPRQRAATRHLLAPSGARGGGVRAQITTHLDHDARGLGEVPERDPEQADECRLGLVRLRTACAQDAPP